LKEFGKIDILINNAGGQFPINAENLSAKGFEGLYCFFFCLSSAVVRNNLLGTWNMTRAVGTKALIPQQSGSVVNVIAQIRKYEYLFPDLKKTAAFLV
jgi:citronellol/citronellal dehydrogenase